MFGYSINVLTMFAMVLAVGILVDDAIVVIENVERIMSEEGLPPREATKKAMGQITAALVGISVTLVSVFLPMAFFAGSVGNIYRQFSLVMVSSMLFSVFLALSLTPALCATFLKPVEAGHKHEKRGFFGWFNRGFKATTHGYENWVAKILRRTGRFLILFALIVGLTVFMFLRMPSSFLPTEDQGYLIANVQLPPGATQGRTLAVMQQAEGFFLNQPEVSQMVSVLGFSFSGSGQNAALAFVTLKPWDEREGPQHSAQGIAGRAFGALSKVARCVHLRAGPAGDSRAGHRDRLLVPAPGPRRQRPCSAARGTQPDAGDGRQEQGPRGRAAGRARGRAAAAGRHRPRPGQCARRLVRHHQRRAVDGARLDLRQRLPECRAPAARRRAGRCAGAHAARRPAADQRAQQPGQAGADGGVRDDALDHRTDPDHPLQRLPDDADLRRRRARATRPAMRWSRWSGSRRSCRPASRFEWTGQSREERLSGSTATILLGFSLLAVFLCLSALYESWSIPFSVLLAVPLGVLGAVLGATFRDMPNDVFFKVGLITVIGLSAKNAILIIEFAKDLHAQGKDLVQATLEAVHLRFRPILMTSIAFILGVLPLVVSTGAGSASQRAIGTGVMSGMITATVLAVFFVPVFFVVVRRFFKGSDRQRKMYAHEMDGPAKPAVATGVSHD